MGKTFVPLQLGIHQLNRRAWPENKNLSVTDRWYFNTEPTILPCPISCPPVLTISVNGTHQPSPGQRTVSHPGLRALLSSPLLPSATKSCSFYLFKTS